MGRSRKRILLKKYLKYSVSGIKLSPNIIGGRKLKKILTARASSSLIRVRVEQILIILALVVLLFQLKFYFYGDADTRFQALDMLFNQGKLSEMPYSFIGPLFSSPVYLIGKALGSPRAWCGRYNLFLFVLGLFLINQVLKDCMDGSTRRKFFLILILGSMFPHHLSTYFGEVFTAVLVAFGILAVTVKKYVNLGWTALILGVANIPASAIGLVLIITAFILKRKKLRYVLVPLAVIVIILAEAWIRRGSPFMTGYELNYGHRTFMPYSHLPGFSYPLFFGLISILISFGKGIVFFAPGMFLPVRKYFLKYKNEVYISYKLWIWFVIGLVLVYAKWWAWYGGWFWGPRFFLFASIPASMALAIRLSSSKVSIFNDLVTLAALGLSFWVGINGAVFGLSTLESLTRNFAQTEAYCWYIPEFSVLWRPFVVLKDLSSNEIFIIAFSSAVFLYIALPFLLRIAKSVLSELERFWGSHFPGSRWRF